MENQDQDLTDTLKDISQIFQKTRKIWHTSFDFSKDFSDLKSHVRELFMRSRSIRRSLKFPANVEYKQKAGAVLVASGSLPALCDMAERWFEITRETSTIEDIDFLEDILECLGHFTDHTAVVCNAVQAHERFVPALLTRLKELYEKQPTVTLESKEDTVTRLAMVILHNIASFQENIHSLREHPTIVSVLHNCAGRGTHMTRFAALTAMAELVTEEEVHMLATTKEMIGYILEQLEKAQKREDAYSPDSQEVGELIRAISILAKNDDNITLLMKEGVLRWLEIVLEANIKRHENGECSRCHECTHALLLLSDIEEHQHEILKRTNLLNCVIKIYCDKSSTHSNDCFNAAKDVLWKLRGLLQKHPSYTKFGLRIEYENTDRHYIMSAKPRGLCLIINNRDFVKETPDAKELECRHGTDLDRDKLLSLFGGMEFLVTSRNNLNDTDMLDVLNAMAKQNHDEYNVFVCCILSHGDPGIVYGANSIGVPIGQLTAPFTAKRCESLRGKPKLFFLQSCQGNLSQTGYETRQDAVPEARAPAFIPDEADFLLGYSTVPGYVSYRHTYEGSWYISELCTVLSSHYEDLDILEILTNVNEKVSKKWTLKKEGRCVQIPAPMYTLRKKLIFGK